MDSNATGIEPQLEFQHESFENSKVAGIETEDWKQEKVDLTNWMEFAPD